jgi:hypothetical protein
MTQDNKKKTIKHNINKRRKTSDPSRYYIDIKEYTDEVIKFVRTETASDRLGELWKLHVDKCASAACFKSYTYLDEMKGQALLFLTKYSKSFDPNRQRLDGKTPNAFAYCTTIIHRAFIQVIKKEKKHSILKDKLVKLHQRVIYNLNQYNFQPTLDD